MTMKIIERNPPRAKPKTFEQEVFVADVAIAGAHVTLSLRRGGHVRTFAPDAGELERRFDEDLELRVDPTARLLLLGPDVWDVASLTVVDVDRAFGRLTCLFVSGKLDANAREGHVLFAGYPRAAQQLGMFDGKRRRTA